MERGNVTSLTGQGGESGHKSKARSEGPCVTQIRGLMMGGWRGEKFGSILQDSNVRDRDWTRGRLFQTWVGGDRETKVKRGMERDVQGVAKFIAVSPVTGK